MGQTEARELVDHVDQLWSPSLTFDERQVWGRLLLPCDMDYAIAALSMMKKATPTVRPDAAQFPDAYLATVADAHDAPRTITIDPEPDAEPELPMDRDSVAGRHALVKLQAERAARDARRAATGR